MIFGLAALCVYLFYSQNKEVDFNTQVKPILNKKCIACHGGVKQQGGLSFLFREDALAQTKSGKYAIVPGHAESSELMVRIKSDDDEERMPHNHEKLSDEEINIFEKWINQGAKWGTHWAYLPVVKPGIPTTKDEWITNDIDRFVLDKQHELSLSHNELADKATLLRRVSLDLTGLPPSEALANQYFKDGSKVAYSNLVDELLKAPSYGEKWTAMWLDLARYADSKGFESDAYRNIWKYRDWLINAFNKDVPYDQFLIQQLAGDIMPNADDNTLLATAFHRNSMVNDEGGTQNEEYRVVSVIDRVNTTWSALMGTSFNCVQCHSHPYDPFKHEEYYKFMAYFNNDADEDLKLEYPIIKNYSGNDSLLYLKIMDWVNTYGNADERRYFKDMLLHGYPRYNITHIDYNNEHAFIDNNEAVFRNGGVISMNNVKMEGENLMLLVFLFHDGKFELYYDDIHTKPFASVDLKKSMNLQFVRFPVQKTNQLRKVFIKYTPKRDIEQNTGASFLWLKVGYPLPGIDKLGYAQMVSNLDALMTSWADGTPILRERPSHLKRKTYILERGVWNRYGKEVTPGTPAVLNAFGSSLPSNRYGMALWLTDKKNPLVARTMVNRIWEQLFGRGLVETLEDLGTQSSTPSNKALLDYLAYQFMYQYQWSIKKLLKEIVTSSTYQQSSYVNQEMLQKDAYNVYCTRGPRLRLSAEQIRDQNLALSGLLSPKMYGKSVMPYQPNGIWKSPYNSEVWKASTNGDQYRRSVYTHIKRTATFPAFSTFDMGNREVCSVRRITTNTPLQALNALNDTTFIIAARTMAQKINHTQPFAHNANVVYKKMFYKDIDAKKLAALQKLYTTSLQHYTNNKKDAEALLANAKAKEIAKEAAWTVTLNAMMNLDEWLNKN